jgi:hypothetical protein
MAVQTDHTLKPLKELSMKHNKKNRQRSLLVPLLMCLGLLLVGASPVYAQAIGDVANNASSSLNSLGQAIQIGGRTVGIALIVIGLITHYKAHKEQGQGRANHGVAVVGWLIGAALFYVGSVVHTSGNTLFGSGGGDTNTINVQTGST